MSIGENIRRIRKDKKLTQKELGEKLKGISQQQIGQWENGNKIPKLETIRKIADALEVGLWEIIELDQMDLDTRIQEIKKMVSLLTPEGLEEFDRLVTEALDLEKPLLERYRQLNQTGQEKAIDQVELLTKIPEYRKEYAEKAKERTLQRNAHTSNIRLINYYYRLASAGTGQIVFDMPPTDKIEIPDIPEYKKVDYAIGVNGNSMEPEFSNGDILLIEMTEEIDIGEIGIFIVDNESYVKKLGNGELISLNPDYENIQLTENSRCMGKVVGSL